MTTRILGRNRDFTLLWTGGAVSAVGSNTSMISYPLLVLTTTGSAALVGVTMAVGMVTRLVAGFPGGVLVDRMNRKHLMLLCDLIRALAQSVIVLTLVTGTSSLAVILPMIALESAFSSVFAAAEPTAVRLVVAKDQLAVALARNEARGAAAMMSGPPLGGLLFAFAPWLPFLFDTVSYLVSFLLVAFLRTPLGPRSEPADARDASAHAEGDPPKPNVLRNIIDGLRFVWQQKFVRSTLLLIAGNNMVSNAILLVAIVLSQQHGAHEFTTGLILTIAGVGSLAGALVAPLALRRLSVRAILVLNRALWMVLLALMAFTPSTYVLGLLIGLMFVPGPAGSSAVTALQMRLTPEDLQGRGRATAGILVGVATPLGTPLVGFALEHVTATTTVLGLAGWMALMTAIAITSRPVRKEGTVVMGAQPGESSIQDRSYYKTSSRRAQT